MALRRAIIALLATGLLTVTTNARAEIEALLLLGPISEAVQETVLLIRRGDNFVTSDSLVIGCIAGASAGAMVSFAPLSSITIASVASPLGEVLYVIGSSLMGCGMAVVGGMAGMATSRGLDQIHDTGH